MDSRERRKRKRELAKRRHRKKIFVLICLLVIALGACGLNQLRKQNNPEPPKTEGVAKTEAPKTEKTETPATTEETEGSEKSEDTMKTETEQTGAVTEAASYSDTLQGFSRVTKPVILYEEPGSGATVLELEEGDYVENYGELNGFARVNYNEYAGYVDAARLENASKDNQFKVMEGTLIANKEFGLPETYDPGLKTEVSIQFEKMKADVESEGMTIDIGSGYRSYEYQLGVIERNIAAVGEEETMRSVAPAGKSEHQTGLAIDIINDEPETNIDESFKDTDEGIWLAANSYKYGFILRYPQGKEEITGYMYEPWHFRYVGEELAAKIFDSGLTLEEYFGIE